MYQTMDIYFILMCPLTLLVLYVIPSWIVYHLCKSKCFWTFLKSQDLWYSYFPPFSSNLDGFISSPVLLYNQYHYASFKGTNVPFPWYPFYFLSNKVTSNKVLREIVFHVKMFSSWMFKKKKKSEVKKIYSF